MKYVSTNDWLQSGKQSNAVAMPEEEQVLSNKQIKENLLILKKRSGLTAYQIAQKADMKENTVYSAFNPSISRSIRVDTLMRLCDGMGASYEEVFTIHRTKEQRKQEEEGYTYLSSIQNSDYKRLALAELRHIYEEDVRASRAKEDRSKKASGRRNKGY